MEINGFNIEPIEGEAGIHDVSFSPASINESLDKTVEIDAVVGDKAARVTLFHEGLRELFNVTEGPFMVAEGTFNVLKIRPPRVPEGYTEVEYISTNGGQYIDTEYYPNPSSLIRYDVRFTNTNAQYSGNYIAPYCAFGFGASEMEIYFGDGYTPNGAPSTIRQQIVFDLPNGRVLVNGINVYTKTISDTSDSSLILFALRRASAIENYCYMEMYSCQIYDNGELVRDYVPVVNSIGTQGLYDLKNAKFYPMILAGYTQVEYIENDGSWYIDTGFAPNQDTRLVMDLELFTQDFYAKCLLGERNTGTGSDLFSVWIWEENQFRTDFGSSANNSYLDVPSIVGRYVLDKNRNTTTIGGYSVTCADSTWSTEYSIYLFSNNYNNTQDGDNVRIPDARIYSCQIYDNDVLVRDYIPVINSSGEQGLYDLVNNTFYSLITS